MENGFTSLTQKYLLFIGNRILNDPPRKSPEKPVRHFISDHKVTSALLCWTLECLWFWEKDSLTMRCPEDKNQSQKVGDIHFADVCTLWVKLVSMGNSSLSLKASAAQGKCCTCRRSPCWEIPAGVNQGCRQSSQSAHSRFSAPVWRTVAHLLCILEKKKTRSSFNSLCFPLTLFFTLEATYYLIFFYVSYRGQQLGGFLDHASLIALLRALGKDPRCPSRKWTPTGQSR